MSNQTVTKLQSRFAATIAALRRATTGGAALSAAEPKEKTRLVIHGLTIELGSERAEAELFLSMLERLIAADADFVLRFADAEFGIRTGQA